eukprot:CAMPEP_0197701540 /NCGR_PEP_ID=MMETSP1338-20131121/123377_1 /TAXON_ID=43686 ORGANISM="Pelagodinium beii, Strain RCC1491" /NCGR_SAMPLE_ID=MMETSP1338 /ASSEMBLY_ACC=CAM_ASM_000754 /LENGTH=52 /DNA_ID=CAMNT_0043285245 /DNA_START=15 /DNA_END=170 /DNA_ORIENTATION=+
MAQSYGRNSKQETRASTNECQARGSCVPIDSIRTALSSKAMDDKIISVNWGS